MFCPTIRNLALALPALAVAALSVTAASAQQFDPEPVWPLCGNITVSPPQDWFPWTDCPLERAGDPAYADQPISDTFGPRLDGDETDFDWHRGIDLPTPLGTPVFAIAAGKVVDFEWVSATDKTLVIEHPRPGNEPADGCEPNGCYYSRYLHLLTPGSSVGPGAQVYKGQVIAATGFPAKSGFRHLHFEIRSALDDKPDGSQREAIHPLAVLPRSDSGVDGVDSTMAVAFDTDPAAHGSAPAVDTSDPENPIVTVEVTLPDGSQELDLDRVEVAVYRNLGDSLAVVPQPNDYVGNKTTPEGVTWQVHPPSFGIQDWNRWFTYKNGFGVPYSDFWTGADHESPWHLDLPSVWDPETTPDFHLTHRKYDDTAVPGDEKLMAFNGVEVYAPKFNATSSFNQYRLYVTFLELDGVDSPDELCLEALAYDVAGNRSPVATWGNCTITP